jgi:hypothetical protein
MSYAARASYDAFRQRVRRHRRSEVLKAVARFSSHLQEIQYGQAPALNVPNYVTPFALAGIARTALIANNEHRDPGVSGDDVVEMCEFYANIEEPSFSEVSGLDQIRGLLNRITL